MSFLLVVYVDLNPIHAGTTETPRVRADETTGRCQRPDKRGAIAERVPKLLERLGIEPEAFIAASTTLLQRFGSAVGTPLASPPAGRGI
ncbi:hypothetical protein [Halomonas sp. NO4]|uniref:hypothetical protein n=1 Tax=Halomonas sp. NO4 TaxID=2484813 RepID=UPI0013D05DA7|nr:hypothetical protein [Halomonas sp. NO4]